MALPSVSRCLSLFNPCSEHFTACSEFKWLNGYQKAAVITLTFLSLIGLFTSVAVFRILTHNFYQRNITKMSREISDDPESQPNRIDQLSRSNLQQDNVTVSLTQNSIAPKPTKVSIELPISHKNELAALGIIWKDPEGNSRLEMAELPEGWIARDNPSPYGDQKNITLIDNNSMPRVNLFIQTTTHSAHETVSILSDVQSRAQFEREMKAAEIEKKACEEREKAVQFVLSQRSDKWSKATPFGIFFVKDLRDVCQLGWTDRAKANFCHGFFSSEETANKGKEILKNQVTICDKIFVEEVEQAEWNNFRSSDIQIVNGFSTPNWLKKSLGF